MPEGPMASWRTIEAINPRWRYTASGRPRAAPRREDTRHSLDEMIQCRRDELQPQCKVGYDLLRR
jgi:hypothetical protein